MHGNLEPEEKVWGEVGITTVFNPDGTYDIDFDEDPDGGVYDDYTDPYGGH